MKNSMVTLDVREAIRQGRQPCGLITEAAARLAAAQTLRLLVPFEPVPLYALLGQQGLGHKSTALPDGDWEVLFSRAFAPEAAAASERSACGCPPATPPATVELDARGLEPPQPMIRILEALEDLPANAELCARTDRRPIHLYPELARRGFAGASEEQPDGSVLTRIRSA